MEQLFCIINSERLLGYDPTCFNSPLSPWWVKYTESVMMEYLGMDSYFWWGYHFKGVEVQSSRFPYL